jgi:5'-3' exonuclease
MNSHDRNNRIMELYASGETLEDIAHAAGVSPEQLLAILKQHGGTDSLAARTERPDAKAAVLDAARAEFLNRFGPIAKALALTGSTREQTASRIVLLHPEIDLVRAMEILE